eukprot:4683068-Heterocapsa_arctica.AAC.1
MEWKLAFSSRLLRHRCPQLVHCESYTFWLPSPLLHVGVQNLLWDMPQLFAESASLSSPSMLACNHH